MAKGSFKFHFILLGIGFGFIFSGIYFYVNPQIEYKNEEYTDDQILEMAKVIRLELAKENDGKSIGDDEDNNDTNGEEIEGSDELDKEHGQAEENPQTEESIDNTENNSDETDQDQEQENNINDTNDGTDNNYITEDSSDDGTVDEYVIVKISKGDSSETIARKLFDVEVIDDIEMFHKFIEDNDAEKRLDFGLIEVKKGADYHSLLEVLTLD